MIKVLSGKVTNPLVKFAVIALVLYVLLHIVVGTYFLAEWPIRQTDKFREHTKEYREWAADITDKED